MRPVRSAALALALAAAALPAAAGMHLLSTTGRVTADGKELTPGDTLKRDVEIKLDRGTALFETDAGRLLLKGPAGRAARAARGGQVEAPKRQRRHQGAVGL